MSSFRLLLFALLIVALSRTPFIRAQSIDERLAAMSLEQKVGQMFMTSFYGHPLNEAARQLIAEAQPGAIVLFPSNIGTPEEITRLTNSAQQIMAEQGAPPLLIAVDQEGGIIAHLDDGFTRWPVPSLLAATQDETLIYQVGQAVAAELRAVGINMNLAPIADLLTNPNNPIIGRRAWGDDPALVGPALQAYIAGLQSGGVLATAKHFPGHGDTAEDSHTSLPVLNLNRARLDTLELAPFRATIEAQVGAIMVAHIAFPTLDPDPARPASLSGAVVQGLLREELGYDGIIMTDALDMDAIDLVYSPEAAALEAVRAGHDLIAIGAHVSPEAQMRAVRAVVEAVHNGEIAESRIDASVRRILSAKEQTGLLAWQPLEPNAASARIALESHASLVTELFRAGIALAYDDAGLLDESIAETAVIYPASQASLQAACTAVARGPVRWVGVSRYPSDEEIAWARDAANRSQRTIVFTENVAENPQQRALVQTLPAAQTVVVALASPFDLWHLPRPAAYVIVYSPLRAAYEPLCSILMDHAPARGQSVVDLEARR